jgi:hypothetical protein
VQLGGWEVGGGCGGGGAVEGGGEATNCITALFTITWPSFFAFLSLITHHYELELASTSTYYELAFSNVRVRFVACRLTCTMLLNNWLSPIQEPLDHESQYGFRPNKGCTDANFVLRLVTKRRKEHGLETWVLLLDLVKAFDRVPRSLL